MNGVVVGPSAVGTIMWREPLQEVVTELLWSASRRLLAAPSLVELGMVLEGRRAGGLPLIERLVRDLRLDVVSFGPEAAGRALDAFQRSAKAIIGQE